MFEPDPARDAARRALGLVGEMTARCCLLDPFHEAHEVGDPRRERHLRPLESRVRRVRVGLRCR